MRPATDAILQAIAQSGPSDAFTLSVPLRQPVAVIQTALNDLQTQGLVTPLPNGTYSLTSIAEEGIVASLTASVDIEATAQALIEEFYADLPAEDQADAIVASWNAAGHDLREELMAWVEKTEEALTAAAATPPPPPINQYQQRKASAKRRHPSAVTDLIARGEEISARMADALERAWASVADEYENEDDYGYGLTASSSVEPFHQWYARTRHLRDARADDVPGLTGKEFS